MIKGFYLTKANMPFSQKEHTAVVNTIVLSGLIFAPLAFAMTVLPFEIIDRYYEIISEMGLMAFIAENSVSRTFSIHGGNAKFFQMVGTSVAISFVCILFLWGALRSLGLLLGNWKVNRGISG